nr:hypothetical protein [Lysinibacillus sphaericus]
MELADYKIRIIANACITRYKRGETDIQAVLNSYNLSEENGDLVKVEIMSNDANIEWVENESV